MRIIKTSYCRLPSKTIIAPSQNEPVIHQNENI